MFRVAMAQINPTVGDIEGNVARVLEAWEAAAAQGADLVVFTELTITGYPPEDLLLKPEFVQANVEALQRLAQQGPSGTAAVVGYVARGDDRTDTERWDVTVSVKGLSNAAAVLADGEVVGTYNKGRLPNYGPFDEARYFVTDDEVLVVNVAGVPVGVTICEDLWTDEGPVAATAAAGARVVANLNASPYHRGKRDERERWARHHASWEGVYVVYVNQVGGQDELVFDGDSMLLDPKGGVLARGAQFEADLVVVDLLEDPAPVVGVPSVEGFTGDRPPLEVVPAEPPRLEPPAEVWGALVLGTRDYCRKNGFGTAVIGLSGGIDSAVTAAVAADALGPDNVLGVGMPSPYSSDHSLADAEELTKLLGVGWEVVPIEPAMGAFDGMLAGLFEGRDPDVTEENVQARIRGVILMAISNKFGRILLTTGNKSEMAVGYATLYGDMAGGYAVLKDVPKVLVYELAEWRNTVSAAIPVNTITKPPSAELRPDQFDSDSLPPYEVLDPILEAYVEDDLGVEEIVALGFDEAVVRRVVGLVDRAEYKRRQSAPGVKITDKAFGRDRRVPITNRWRG